MRAPEALASLGIRLKEWRLGYHRVPCPFCRHKKGARDDALFVNVHADGHAGWSCNRCGEKGHTAKLCQEQERIVREAARAGHNRGSRTAAPPRRDGAPTRTDPPAAVNRPAPIRQPSAPQPATRSTVSTTPEPARNMRDPMRGPIEPVPPTWGEAPEYVPYGDAHEKFWDRCEPITASSPVGRYLLGRGCLLPCEAADLRWRPDYPHLHPSARWRGPVMVGRITNALTGEPMSFHFTWVRPDGGGKAPIERARLMAPDMAKQGGVVRLTDDADSGSWLLVGEGIETLLSGLALATNPMMAWACLDAGNMERLPYVEGIDRLIVLADDDRPNPKTGTAAGIKAADELCVRWRYASKCSVTCKVLIAGRPGTDANDLVRSLISPGAAA
jgi:hypothetical protein